MSAAGNAFWVLLDAELGEEASSALARQLCAAGSADGLILADAPDYSMRMHNPDGSSAMCGNGLRCLSLLLHEERNWPSKFELDTPSGRRSLLIAGKRVTAEMGKAADLPGRPSSMKSGIPVSLEEEVIEGWAVWTGNPHLVISCDRDLQSRVCELGPLLERHQDFPEGINSEFVRKGEDTLNVRVWERGAGETLSCGTGAVAVAASGLVSLSKGESCQVDYPGGVLEVRRDRSGYFHLAGEVVRQGQFDYPLESIPVSGISGGTLDSD
ncbi:MAG: diaminopimelate epimerase [Candidatus Krumholzibacteria bacterium]|nr:diaminopimelate epimerase [Candidatus Krumholzibacteria bacterium]MDP6797475.1 diaminopimelate epimerase [Candidatus Krumholzibacteria bacterium]